MLERDRYKLAVAADQNIKERDFWLRKLEGELEKACFPADYLALPERPLIQDVESHSISGDFATGISRLSKGSHVKTYMIFTAALIVLLERYSGKQNVIVGTPIYKQEVDIEFINTVLAIQSRVDKQMSFRDLLLNVRKTINEASEHQNYPIEILIEQLGLSSKTDFPLFDVALLHKEIHDPDYISHIPVNILFSISTMGEELTLSASYNKKIYKASTIRRIFSHFQHLTEQLFAHVDMPLSKADILSEKEKIQILEEFNGKKEEYNQEITIDQRLRESVQKHPHQIAIIGPGLKGEKEIALTYEVLNQTALGLAHELGQGREIQGAVIAVMMEPSVETIALLLGTLVAGGAYLPIDPTSPGERVAYMLADSSVEILVSQAGVGPKLPKNFPVILMENLMQNLSQNTLSQDIHPASHNSSSPAYVIYTSGSTGKPKGVLVEHRNVIAYIYAFLREFDISRTDTFLQQASYAFDAFVEEVYPVLFCGGKLAVAPRDDFWDLNRLESFIISRDVTAISVSPLFLKVVNESSNLDKLPILLYINGGDVLKRDYVDRILDHGLVYNTYGPTETTVCATYYRCSLQDSENPPIGKPITNWNVTIRDKYGRLLPVGVPGELCIQGEGMSRGYLNRPELTAERFSGGLYRSGDLARWLMDGNIDFLGRIDLQVKIRGYRIELGEIENILIKHEAVKEAVVIVREQESENPFLCTYYIPSTGWEEKSSTKPAELANIFKEYLTKFLLLYMVPLFYVPMDRFPQTPNGKLDKKALPAPHLTDQENYIPPSNELEEGLVEIWAEVLGIEKEAVGIDDNFFDIGGQSLSLIKINNRVKEVYNKEISVGNLFRLNTVRALANFILEEKVDLQASEEMMEESLETMGETLNILGMDD